MTCSTRFGGVWQISKWSAWATALFATVQLVNSPDVRAADPESFDVLARAYRQETRPLLKQFCLDCHASAKPEGELDLERFGTIDDVRRSPETWIKVAEMLDNGEMPPKDATSPSPAERKQLRGWVERYLEAEALANAGDPGPVVLRRLSYQYQLI